MPLMKNGSRILENSAVNLEKFCGSTKKMGFLSLSETNFEKIS